MNAGPIGTIGALVFFFLNHTAFKLYSLWQVGYVLDSFYGFCMLSRLDF